MSPTGDTVVTVQIRLDDARRLVSFARLGLVWTLRHDRIGALAHHSIGRGLYTLVGAIDRATVNDERRLAA